MRSLSEIAKEATPFVSEQLDDNYDKYLIEQEMRWIPHPIHRVEDDIMPKILNSWIVSEDRFILINCVHHDVATYAFEFNSFTEIELALKGKKFYLNPFSTYVIPILKGKVLAFDMYDDQGHRIYKYEIIEHH